MQKFDSRNTDVYTTRLLFRKTIAMRGAEAAELFNDPHKFKRQGATPKRFQKTLFGEGGVQGLDGEHHRHRKALFMSIMKDDQLERLDMLFEKTWKQAALNWQKGDQIVLFHEAEKILTQAICEWAALPLPPDQVELRARQLSRMIDGSGGAGSRHYRGRKARKRAERWIRKMVVQVRKDKLQLPEDSIFHAFCHHGDPQGKLLSAQIVAVEMLNIIRPTVAIARYIVFLAHALHLYPIYRDKLKGNEKLQHYFVQEVRRHYPFFPFVSALVKERFQWKGVDFPEGRRVLLDLYATNHDGRLWHQPEVFFPERFAHWKENPWDLIPQGAGDHHRNHRCAGEWITINLMKKALAMLVEYMDYQVPEQDLAISLSRIPAIPRSRFLISGVKLKSNIPDASSTYLV